MAPSHNYLEVPQASPDAFYNSPDQNQSQDDDCAAPRKAAASRSPVLVIVLLSVTSLILGIVIGAFIGISFVTKSVWQTSNGVVLKPAAASATQIIDGIEILGTQCGGNWREAKALGCHFDVMASRWYAPECFDKAVLDGMLEEQPYVNFTWYVDKQHSEIYPSGLVLRGEFDKVYPSGDYHIYHCLYLWRRLHHALLKNKPVDDDLFEYGHTLHCTRMIMQWMDPNIQKTAISSATSGTPFCRRSRLGVLD